MSNLSHGLGRDLVDGRLATAHNLGLDVLLLNHIFWVITTMMDLIYTLLDVCSLQYIGLATMGAYCYIQTVQDALA